MAIHGKTFDYHDRVRWTEAKMGVLTAEGKPDFQVATPPEFKGHAGIWSPEDLFLAAVNMCVMSTFLAFAERTGLNFRSYESEADGTVELVDGVLQFTKITLRPALKLQDAADREKAHDVLSKAEANCLISKSIKTAVMMEPRIE